MKKRLLIILPALLLLLSSCENDFSVNAKWKDITVVYGLLDPTADTNWVRIQRAYLGEDAAYLSYDKPDSLYYKNVLVFLEAFAKGSQGEIGARVDSFLLVRDDSKKLEEGIFTTEGFHLYRTTQPISEDYIYKLTVRKPNTDYPEASATTTVIEGDHGSNNTDFRFVNPNPVVVSGPELNGGTFSWFASDGAEIYELDMYLHFWEMDKATRTVESRTIKMDLGTREGASAEPADGRVNYIYGLDRIYSAIAAELEPTDTKLRFVRSFTLELWAGGESLAKYIALNTPTAGINQEKPEFPGIENGIGLFSSRTKTTVEDIKWSSQLNTKFYLSGTLCDYGFAIVTTGDTCYCNRIEGLGPQKECF